MLVVNASDRDTGDNAKIKYTILNPTQGFSMGEENGIVYVNQSNISSFVQDFQIAVKAEDYGKPPLYSVASVRIKMKSGLSSSDKSNKRDYK